MAKNKVNKMNIKNSTWMMIMSVICIVTSIIGFFEAQQMDELQVQMGIKTNAIQLSIMIMIFAVVYAWAGIHIQKRETESYSKK